MAMEREYYNLHHKEHTGSVPPFLWVSNCPPGASEYGI